MFYEQLERLCASIGTTPTAFVKNELKLSTSKVTAWKSGSIPKIGTLRQIANHFNVSVGYLFDGNEPSTPQSTADRELLELIESLSPEEIKQAKSFIKYLLSERGSGSSERSGPDTSYEAKEEAV